MDQAAPIGYLPIEVSGVLTSVLLTFGQQRPLLVGIINVLEYDVILFCKNK